MRQVRTLLKRRKDRGLAASQSGVSVITSNAVQGSESAVVAADQKVSARAAATSSLKALGGRVKPKSGFSHFFHIGLSALLPGLIFVLVRLNFTQVGLALILLSKWRMFAVKARHWPANIRANAVDIIVGVSLLVFMSSTSAQVWQLVWAFAYGLWLVLIKPASTLFMTSTQALLAQLVGLMALFLAFGDAPVYGLVIATWVICQAAARHFFTSFDESMAVSFAYMWGYFGVALTWILSHWLLFYGSLAQPTLLLCVIGFGLATLYYLEKNDRLSRLLQRQFVFVMIAIVVIVIAFSDWGDKTV